MRTGRKIARRIATIAGAAMMLMVATAAAALAYPAHPDGGGPVTTSAATGGGWSGWEITLVVAAVIAGVGLIASLQTHRRHHRPRYGGAAPTA